MTTIKPRTSCSRVAVCSLALLILAGSDTFAQRQLAPNASTANRSAASTVRQNFARLQSGESVQRGAPAAQIHQRTPTVANPVQQTAYFGDTNAMGDTFIEGSAASNVSLPAGGGLMSGCGGAGCASGCSDCCGFDDGCGLGTCGSMCGCLGLYGSVEYLMWWEKGDFLPPLVASSPDGTSSENTGVVGFSNALFGDETFNNDLINGFRVTLGTWVNGNNNLGVIGRYFNTEDAEASFSGDSNRFPRLGRPFFNTFTNEEDSLLLGFPDEITGDVTATFRSQARGAEANIRKLYTCGGNYRVDVVYGYRYMGIDESVRIDNTLRFIDPQSIQVGTSIEQFDLFDIENEFHGGELGFMGHSIQGCWAIDFIAKVALGNTTQRTSISGQSITTPATGSALTTQGGLLTQPSNIGMHEDNQFTVIPEFTATASYALTYNLDLSIGYTFLYVNHVARPSNAIDRSVNLTQQTALDGELRPVFPGTDSDYLLQGINFGLNFRY